nr:PREDICTED: toll-like receptor 13 [Latimeria chalumnae]|eukprot:XP_014349438.1 PREDICTED: toll-like receptor 13 [Latimeria chalumnae]
MKLSSSNLSALFQKLVLLEKLSLVETKLEILPRSMLPTPSQLRFLSLTGNHIKSINVDFFSNLNSLKYVNIYCNSLSCTCINSWLQMWSIRNPKVQVIGFYQYQCADCGGLFSQFDFSLCNVDISMHFFICTFTMDLLLIVTSITYTKLTPCIRYLWYLTRAWLHEACGTKTKLYKYDAFIFYNSKDEDWVMTQLYPQMEQQALEKIKLCFYHRDFDLGRDILDNIEKAIYQSRKMLCVISKSYLQSDWCTLEIQLANIRLLFTYNDVLILIFLEHILDYQLASYHRLCKLVKKKTFIQWPEKEEEWELFWMRLRKALRPESVATEETQISEL